MAMHNESCVYACVLCICVCLMSKCLQLINFSKTLVKIGIRQKRHFYNMLEEVPYAGTEDFICHKCLSVLMLKSSGPMPLLKNESEHYTSNYIKHQTQKCF